MMQSRATVEGNFNSLEKWASHEDQQNQLQSPVPEERETQTPVEVGADCLGIIFT